MERRLPYFVAVWAAACASGGSRGTAGTAAPTPQPPAAASAQPPARVPRPDVVRYGPSAMRYLIHQRVHVEQTFGGQQQAQDLGARIFVAATIVGPADSAGYPTTFTVDSVVADSGTPPAVALNVTRTRHIVYNGRVDKRGEFHQGAMSDSVAAQSLVQLLGHFREFLPRIPAQGATLGAQWTDTLTGMQRGAGAAVTRKAVVHSTAAAWEDRGGIRSLRLDIGGAYTVAGAGDNGGQPFELGGSGTASGVAYIAVDGRFLGGESRDSSNVTVTLPVQGLTIPVLQVSRATVTVQP